MPSTFLLAFKRVASAAPTAALVHGIGAVQRCTKLYVTTTVQGFAPLDFKLRPKESGFSWKPWRSFAAPRVWREQMSYPLGDSSTKGAQQLDGTVATEERCNQRLLHGKRSIRCELIAPTLELVRCGHLPTAMRGGLIDVRGQVNGKQRFTELVKP